APAGRAVATGFAHQQPAADPGRDRAAAKQPGAAGDDEHAPGAAAAIAGDGGGPVGGGHHLLHRRPGELPGQGRAWHWLAVERREHRGHCHPGGGAGGVVVAAAAALPGVRRQAGCGIARARALSKLPEQGLMPGLTLATFGAITFSGKAIIVKLAYRYVVDAVTLIMLRMLFALPLFAATGWWASRGKAALSLRDWLGVTGLGITGYYLSSFLDFAGLQYISASLERLILYLNPTL